MNILGILGFKYARGIAAGLTIGTLGACATPGEAPRSVTQSAAPAAPAAAAPAPAQVPAAAQAPAASAPKPVAPAPAPPPILGFDEAVLLAANNLFSKAELPAGSTGAADKHLLVIDPLVDGNSGFQSVATQSMETRISELVRSSYPKFDLQPFSTSTLARGPFLFIGTFTPVDKEGKNVGAREWYRVCLALVDLRSGKIVSKGFARSSPENVDVTPTAFFRDIPAWAPDPATEGYVKTCQGTKVGDPINPVYWDRIVAAALINDAINAYNNNRYEEALDLYKGVLRTGVGEQLRVYNGIYLASWKLGRRDEATQAFGRIVDHGLAQNRLGVKFLFRPGSTLFLADPQVSGPYGLWLKQIAEKSAGNAKCMEVAGHTSRTGAEPLNDRLSLLRAQYVKQRLEADTPRLSKRTTAVGKGSRETISGLGTDDARDALDRRVEFKVVECGA